MSFTFVVFYLRIRSGFIECIFVDRHEIFVEIVDLDHSYDDEESRCYQPHEKLFGFVPF